MQLNLSEENLKTALEVAFLNAIGENGKELILKEVVTLLTKPQSDSYYGKKSSMLTDIMYGAARDIAKKLLENKLENDEEFKTAVISVYAEAFQKVFVGEGRERLVTKISDGIYSIMSKERDY